MTARHTKLHGVLVALVTPMKVNEEIDYAKLADLTDLLIGQGVHGLIPLGSTGEYYALSADERERVLVPRWRLQVDACRSLAEEMGLGEEEMAKSLLASGLIGVFIATRWTFAAEVGGCQAEGGSAASMAAAALVTLADGPLAQAVAAASMAFQSMIGLICDPVANRVEVPCLGKNVMAASNSLCCANMVLAGDDPVIPLDEVIETARRVGGQMPRELRCTALGGLSITPTLKMLEQKLAAGCSRCSCH